MVDWAMRNRAEQAYQRTLITPEGVDLNLRLADASQRLGAFRGHGLGDALGP